ncbi:MAG: hypothetical protein E6Q06_04220 [Candidatus Moraniibacteriota bacterium]|nr:MAG: hypothetical protein E6Q06_04220 [Candidatus Moranbacteria bacterium]
MQNSNFAMRRIWVVTVATHNQGYLSSLEWCLKQAHGGEMVRFVQLGRGHKWNNYGDKLRLLFAFLERLCGGGEGVVEVAEQDLVIFCDAYDVLFDPQRDFARLADIFLASRADLLFSVVDISRQNSFIQKCAHKILTCLDFTHNALTCNGGLYMGKSWALLAFMRQAEKLARAENLKDDEKCINELLNKSKCGPARVCPTSGFWMFPATLQSQRQVLVGLDVNSTIFFNSPPQLNFTSLLKTGEARPTVFDENQAFFYHFIGNQDLTELCAYEGIRLPGSERNEIYGKMHKLAHYLGFFKTELLVLAVLAALLAATAVKEKQKR